jgi:hypothetical protein
LQTIKECEDAGERLLKDFPKVKQFVNLAFSVLRMIPAS